MIKIPIYDAAGGKSGNIELDEASLGGSVKYDLLREAMAIYESRMRVLTKATKTRGEVAGTTKKMYRQKHTGLARAGSVRSPIRRGGGMTFALDSPNYRKEMPRTARRAALKSALLSRFIDDEAAVIPTPELEAPKTRVFAELLEKIGVEKGESCLVITAEHNENLYKSARNIPGIQVKRLQDINAYDVLYPHRVLFTKQAMDAFMEVSK
jgi:large subunit ribosomal protein L4